MGFSDTISKFLMGDPNPVRDAFFAGLEEIGVKAEMVDPEEFGYSTESFGFLRTWKVIGLIKIAEGPITRAVMMRTRVRHRAAYFVCYLAPDIEIDTRNQVNIHSLRETARVGFLGLKKRSTKFDWAGQDLDLGIVERLNADKDLKDFLLVNDSNVEITINPQDGYWGLTTNVLHGREGGALSPNRPRSPTTQEWQCYESIARHLVGDVPSVDDSTIEP